MNKPGNPVIAADPSWWEREHQRLNFEPIFLDDEQMRFVEEVMPSVCERGGWGYHTSAGGPDHVHVLLTAEAEGDAVRKWFKRWLGEEMSVRWPRAVDATWWAEGGSVKWVWERPYFENVFGYLERQRASGPSR